MLVGSPGERWAIDLCGPFTSSNGFKYLFTAICTFSKFGVCVAIRDKSADTVAKAIVDNIFLKWGLPHEILTDQGGEFEAALLAELLKTVGVTRLRTSGYRPQTNGACEGWHRTLNAMFAKVVADNQKDWSSWVPYVTFCYNATQHSATGFAPFFIFTGRMPLWNVDLMLPNENSEQHRLPEYAALVVDRLEKASALVRNHLQKAAQTASKWYNRKAKLREFKPGDLVRVYYPRRIVGRTLKWQNFYRTQGEVVKRLNDAIYLVKSSSWKTPKVIHTDKLKPIYSFSDC